MKPKQLTKIRVSKQLTQKEFGQVFGITAHTVYMWESGKQPIPKWLHNWLTKTSEQITQSQYESDAIKRGY